MGTLLPILMVLMSVSSTPSFGACHLLVSQTGPMLTVTGAVDPEVWSRGTYEMNVTVKQGSNRSVSSQAGRFADHGESGGYQDGYLTLSTSSVHVQKGGEVSIKLTVRDGARTDECETKATP